MTTTDTTILQSLIDAHNPKYAFRGDLRTRLGKSRFLDPLTSDEVRWINNQLDPQRSRKVGEPRFSVANLYEYIDLLNRFIAEDGYYQEILDEFKSRCTEGERGRLMRRLEKQRIAVDAAFNEAAGRRDRTEWSQQELDTLDVAVADCGYNWKAIKAKYPQLRARSSGMQLRDKCLQIKRKAARDGLDMRVFKNGIYSEPIPGKEVGQIARVSKRKSLRRERDVMNTFVQEKPLKGILKKSS